jgi:hypothetical protein
MKPTLAADHHSASLILYGVVAFNTRSKSGYTINRNEAAKILADLLHIDISAPRFWLRGDFRKHPLSRENFLTFVRAYRTRRGLESAKEIAALAIDLYGLDAKKALELLDPQDRKILPAPKAKARGKEKDLAQTLYDVIEPHPREEANQALVKLMARMLEQSQS